MRSDGFLREQLKHGACAKAGRLDAPGEHDESRIEPTCCFCGAVSAVDMHWVAVRVAPKPRELPLFPDRPPVPGVKPALRVLRGGKVEG